MNQNHEASIWNPVCSIDDIVPNTGVCALVKDRHIAVFHVHGKTAQLFAIDNYDPIAQASVLSRGLIGSIGERIVVASPIYKQHFDLQNGACLEAPEHSVCAYPVKVEQNTVWVAV